MYLSPTCTVIDFEKARARRDCRTCPSVQLEYAVLLGKIERLEKRMDELDAIDAFIDQLDDGNG